MTPPFTGGCRCGAVRFSLPTAPIATRLCWCRDCQYFSAGNASANAIFRTEGMTLTGAPAAYESPADSGNLLRRRFCGACGTPLFSEAVVRPGMMVVRLGTLDDAAGLRPESIIWAKSAPVWACFDPALPRAEGQGPAPGAKA